MDARELILGRELIESGLLRPEQLRLAHEYQSQISGRLEDILVKLDLIDEARLSTFVAEREHMATVDLSERRPDEALMERIPRQLIERHEVLPFRLDADTILLAMSDPTDFRVIEEVQFITDEKVETALAPRTALRERIERYYASLPPLEVETEEDPAALAERLLEGIADPAVAALARVLLDRGLIDADEWRDALRPDR